MLIIYLKFNSEAFADVFKAGIGLLGRRDDS